MNSTDIPIVEIDGQYLYKGKKRFIVRGVVYQPYNKLGGRMALSFATDPVADTRYGEVLRDVQVLKQLRINTLWIYNHTPKLQHKECMDLLAANDIYVVFATMSRREAMYYNTNRPSGTKLVNEETLNVSGKIIDSVAQFRNTLGVCVGSGVVNSKVDREGGKDLQRFRYAQAIEVREMKRYMRYRNYDTGQRILPLCVSEGQRTSLNTSSFQFFTDLDRVDRPAGGRIDFYCFTHFGFDQSAYEGSQNRPAIQADERIPLSNELAHTPDDTTENQDDLSWSQQIPTDKFASAPDPIPVLISEYGRTSQQPRNFQESRQLYGTAMNSRLLNTLSGGFIYEFYGGDNKFGLVKVHESGSLEAMPDFPSLRHIMQDAAGSTADAHRIDTE